MACIISLDYFFANLMDRICPVKHFCPGSFMNKTLNIAGGAPVNGNPRLCQIRKHAVMKIGCLQDYSVTSEKGSNRSIKYPGLRTVVPEFHKEERDKSFHSPI